MPAGSDRGYVWTRGGTAAVWSEGGAGLGAVLGLVLGAVSDERWVPAVLQEPAERPIAVTGPLRLGWRVPLGF